MKRKAATFTELMIYTILFVLFIGMGSGIFYWARRSMGGVKRIDNFHGLRISSHRIAEELSYGVRVLFPPATNQIFHQLVFRNNKNEIVAVFLDQNSKLTLINYEQTKSGNPLGKKILADRAIEFLVERPDNHLIKFQVKILDENNVEFVLANGVTMRNTDINEPW